MNNIKNISIPQACHQSWQQMNEVNNGRHCEHCCKIVVDFTKMTNHEIIDHLSTKNNVCGRFEQEQLNNVNHWLYIRDLSAKNWWKRIALLLSFFGSMPLFKATGQVRPTGITYATDTSKNDNKTKMESFTLGKIAAIPDLQKFHTIKGRVIGSDDGLPIIGATIKLKGANIETQTNISGDFSINVPNSIDALTVSFVGYVTQQIPLTNFQFKKYQIELKISPVTMGEVVIAPPVKPK